MTDDVSTTEDRLGRALAELSSTTSVSADGFERIEERVAARRRRRARSVLVAGPAFALAAVVVLVTVVLPGGDTDPSVSAGPADPSGPARYAPQDLGSEWSLGAVNTTAGSLRTDASHVRVYGRRAPDGVSLDGFVLVVTPTSAADAELLRAFSPGDGGRPQRCPVPAAPCTGPQFEDVVLRGQTMQMEAAGNGYRLAWDEPPGGPTAGVIALGISRHEMLAVVEGVAVDGPAARATVLPDGFVQVHEGAWPPRPDTLAERRTEQSWEHLRYSDGDFSLSVYEGPTLSLDTVAWLEPDSRASLVGGRPALYSPAARSLTWLPRPGVLLVLTAPGLGEAGVHARAERVRPLDEGAWTALAGDLAMAAERGSAVAGPRSARQPGRVIASGEMDGVTWEAAAYESTTGSQGICVEIKAVPGTSGTCGFDTPSVGRLGTPRLVAAPNGTPFLVVPAGGGVARTRVELSPGSSVEGPVVGENAGLPVTFLLAPIQHGATPTVVIALDEGGRELDRRDVSPGPSSPADGPGPPATTASSPAPSRAPLPSAPPG